MSKVLQRETLEHLETNLVQELSKYELFQNPQINSSPRAIGDTVQEVIGEILPGCFPEGIIHEFNADFARRSMEDAAFYDTDKNYYAIDIKTHNLSTDFNMPNLISAERLSRFYKDSKNYFVILLIEYAVNEGCLTFTKAQFIPIEHLEWSCLRIGALGWGQIQIANSNRIDVNRSNTRVGWMKTLCDTMERFYSNEMNKITERIKYFHTVRKSFGEQEVVDIEIL